MEEDWEQIESFGDEASAAALAGMLRTEGVPARVDASRPVPGLDEGFRVIVPTRLAHRARWLMAATQTTESELTYLATGELTGPDKESGT